MIEAMLLIIELQRRKERAEAEWRRLKVVELSEQTRQKKQEWECEEHTEAQ